jgi:uncharacterized protein (TIGR00296 family)
MLLVTAELCYLCFETLVNHLSGKSSHLIRSYLNSTNTFTDKFPLFVTWTKRGTLRGCIGTFSPQPLLQGLQDYAITAAVKDTRFKPIQESELSSLECEVSLLHSFTKCADLFDWNIGVHGTIFEMDGHSATFLPEVAEQQKWTKEETIRQLAHKAGIRRAITAQDYPDIEVVRYESSRLTVTWKEYQAFLNTVE